MNRRQLLAASAAAGGGLLLGAAAGSAPIARPASGRIRVAFLISDRANVMDLAGPWETFQDVVAPNGQPAFELATIAERAAPIDATGGLRIVPAYTFDSYAGWPNVLVVGAQSNKSPAVMKLLQDAQGRVDVTLSVCTGAFKLGDAGVLDGKRATTHHDFYDAFAKKYPKVELVRGERFVDDGSIVTAGGLTSGIAGALHVIARYFDASIAAQTARYMEFVPTARPA